MGNKTQGRPLRPLKRAEGSIMEKRERRRGMMKRSDAKEKYINVKVDTAKTRRGDKGLRV